MQKTGINSIFLVKNYLYSNSFQVRERVKFDEVSESGLKIRV